MTKENPKKKSVIANREERSGKSSPFCLRDYFGQTSLVIMTMFVMLLSSCDSNRFFEDNQAVKEESWEYSDTKKFTIDVSDTTTHYNILINLRHSFAFDWRNVYVKVGTEFPDGHKTESRVNLLLSEPDGRWYARCIGDNCFIGIPIKEDIMFPQKGKYTFTIQQDMRQNPLPKIRYVGLRIERVIKNEQDGTIKN